MLQIGGLWPRGTTIVFRARLAPFYISEPSLYPLTKRNRSMRTNPYRTSLLTVLLLCSSVFAQDAGPARPKITGIWHVGYFVSDLPQAIAFWHDFLGFDEEYTL